MWSFSWCRTRRQRSDDGCLASGPFRDRPHRSRCRPDLDRLLGALGRRPLPRAILPVRRTDVPVAQPSARGLLAKVLFAASKCDSGETLPPPHDDPFIAVAFSIEQTGSDGNTKIRRGEDWRRSGHNATCTMHDRPFHHTPDHFVSLGLAFLEEALSEELAVWGHDHDDAYRQLPLDDPRQMFSC